MGVRPVLGSVSSMLCALCLWALAGATGCGPDRTVAVPLPDDVDLVAVVFVGPGDAFRSATPLLRLGGDRSVQAELAEGLGDDAFVLGYREGTLEPLLPDPSVYASAALRPRRPQETGLPFPDVAYVAPPGDGTVLATDPTRLPFELTADWAPDCSVQVGAPLHIDTDCSTSPCVVQSGTALACNGVAPLSCGRSSFEYAFDSFGSLVRAELTELDRRTSCSSEGPGDEPFRAECVADDGACTLDVFTGTEDLGITSRTIQVEEVDLAFSNALRPPYGGYLAGPALGPDDGAWVVSYEGRTVGRACGRDRIPTSLLRLALTEDGTPQVLERAATEDCLRLLRPAGDGGFFGMYKEGRWWRWGRFDAQGRQVQSVRVTATATPSLTPSAVEFVEDRWVIALTDYRSRDRRLEEDGVDTREKVAARIVSVRPDASDRLVGPVPIPRQAARGNEVYGIVVDGQGAVVLAQDENEVMRLNRVTLDLTLTENLYPVVARFGTEPEAFGGLSTRATPEELLFFSLSSTRYGLQPSVQTTGVVHLVRERRAVSDRFFFLEPSETTVLRHWPGRPRSVLAAVHGYDLSFRVGDEPDDVRARLARFDLDRPGFTPGFHDVGKGPVTGLAVREDGQVWGVLGRSGQVFHARLP